MSDGPSETVLPSTPAIATCSAPGSSTSLGCRYPIVQTGMGWVSGANLTAATSAAGGFGILAVDHHDRDQFARRRRARVKERTDAPFGVNFRADQPDLDERIRFATEQGVRLFSFAGAPTKDAIAKIHDAGGLVMPTVGARRHAEKMARVGRRRGHRPGRRGRRPHRVGAHVAAAAAGGRGRRARRSRCSAPAGSTRAPGLVAALAYGADGIAMGTRFLLTAGEPGARRRSRATTRRPSVFDTVVTTALDGAPQRVIRTELIDGLEKASIVTRMPKAALQGARVPQADRHARSRSCGQEGLAMRKTRTSPGPSWPWPPTRRC